MAAQNVLQSSQVSFSSITIHIAKIVPCIIINTSPENIIILPEVSREHVDNLLLNIQVRLNQLVNSAPAPAPAPSVEEKSRVPKVRDTGICKKPATRSKISDLMQINTYCDNCNKYTSGESHTCRHKSHSVKTRGRHEKHLP